MTTSDKEADTCLEIDAIKNELCFVCNICKRPNTIKLNLSKGEKPVSSQPMPMMGIARG